MIEDSIGLKGYLTISMNDKVIRQVPNVVVALGKNYVASRMKDNSASVMSHMAIGTGSQSAVESDTTLNTETARVALISSIVQDNKITFRATFSAGTGTGLIKEAGLFDASSSGRMLCRTVFQESNKQSLDSMSIVWTLQVG